MPARVVVLGAGISGLSLAWYLKKKFQQSIEVILLEKSHRAGGLIQTVCKGDFLFEKGPHSIRTSDSCLHTLELIEELSLENEIITAHPSSKRRYLLSKGKLKSLPLSLWEAPFNSIMRKHLLSIIKEPFIKARAVDEESVYSFFSRRFGNRFTEELIDPMISGIYAGDMHKLSMSVCFPSILEKENQYGSVIKGLFTKKSKAKPRLSPFVKMMHHQGMFSFKNGLQTLTDALKNRLDAELLLNTKALRLRCNDNSIHIELENENDIEADYLFSTLPTREFAHLIEDLDFEKKKQLIHFPYSSIGVVNIGYKGNRLQEKGFGYLIPSIENEKILGCIWDSCVFPEQGQNQTRLTMMIRVDNCVEACEQQILEIALDGIERHLNIKTNPDVIDVCFTKQAIPQFEIGYLNWKKNIESHINLTYPRMHLLGTAFKGVSVNDCITASAAAAEVFSL